MSSKLVIVGNTLLVDGKNVQEILNSCGSKFTMFVENPRNGSARVGFSAEAYKGESDDRAFEMAQSQVAAYEALIAAGIPKSHMKFRLVRRGQDGKYIPSQDIWVNTELRAAATPTSTASVVGPTLAEVTEAYFTAGGTEAAPATLPEAAQIGWYKAAAHKLAPAPAGELPF